MPGWQDLCQDDIWQRETPRGDPVTLQYAKEFAAKLRPTNFEAARIISALSREVDLANRRLVLSAEQTLSAKATEDVMASLNSMRTDMENGRSPVGDQIVRLDHLRNFVADEMKKPRWKLL